MKNLIVGFTILIAFPLVLAQSSDSVTASKITLDDGSAVRRNSKGNNDARDRMFQQGGNQRTRIVRLTRGGRKNGYSTTQDGDTIHFEATNVEDSSTGHF